MNPYLFEVSYTPTAWAKQLRNPVNRADAVKPVIERAGGKLVRAYYGFGTTDVYLIIELPDNRAAAALSLAFASGGALAKCEVTVLMDFAEGMEAMKTGGALIGVYEPPD